MPNIRLGAPWVWSIPWGWSAPLGNPGCATGKNNDAVKHVLKENDLKQECIPVGCVLPACRPYLPGPVGGCTWSRGVYLVPGSVPGSGGVHLVPKGAPGQALPPLWTE